jgi:hypothetical protein
MSVLLSVITLLLCVITASLPALHAINLSFDAVQHVRLILFPWLAIVVGLSGLVLAVLHGVRIVRRRSADIDESVVNFCGVVAGVAIVAMVFPWTPVAVAASLRFIAPIMLASALVMRGLRSAAAERLAPIFFSSWAIVMQGILLTLFYTGFGIKVATLWGEHSGDEGHYLCQATSLAQDGDLDVINNLGFEPHEQTMYMLKRKGLPDAAPDSFEYKKCRARLREHMHISPNSKHGAWYSVHLPGLSLLLSVGQRWGMPFRETLLAALSGLTLMVLLLLCRRVNATNIWSVFMVYALVLSSFWAVHSFRALPEMLSALLVTTAVCFGLVKGLYSIPATVITAVALGFLPWAHSRFSIHALLLSCFVVFREFYLKKWRISKELIIFCGIMAAAVAIFGFDQFNRFEGGNPYDVGGVFMSYPIGALRIFFARWSLLFAFPLAAMLIPAGFLGYQHKLLHFTAVTLFVAVIVTASCTVHWSGGSATPGRYFISVLPLFVPLAASVLSARSRAAQLTAVFLALFCVSATFICLFNLEAVGRDMLGNCFYQIRWCMPSLHRLPFPYPPGRYDWAPFTICLLGVSLIILVFRRLPGIVALMLAAATALAAVGFSRHYAALYDPPRRPTATATMLADFNLKNSHIYNIGYKNASSPILLDFSNRFYWPREKAAITTEPPPYEKDYTIYHRKDLAENGWQQKGYRWFTLTAPFHEKFGGDRLLVISGHSTGKILLNYAVKKGAKVCDEGKIVIKADGTFRLSSILELPGGKADIYLLLRMDGSGTCYLDDYDWSPLNVDWQSSGLQIVPADSLPDGNAGDSNEH